MNLTEMVEVISKDLKMDKSAVKKVLCAFMDNTRETVLSGEDVSLKTFGKFIVKFTPRRTAFGYDVPKRITARFVPFPSFCKIVPTESPMEKRSVVLDEEKTKTSSVSKVCPRCGATLKEENYCDSCGTEPFEKRNEEQKGA